MNFFKKKYDNPKVTERDLGPVDGSNLPTEKPVQRVRVLTPVDETYSSLNFGGDYMWMFGNIPEVYWAIDFIAKRISESHFDVKRVKDDSLVLCDRTGVSRLINKPNPITSWRELVYQHFVYKLATGNAYQRAAMSDGMSTDVSLYRWCSCLWELPANYVDIVPANNFGRVPLFGVAELEDIIKGYRLNIGDYQNYIIPPGQIWHDKDGIPTQSGMRPFLKSASRLKAVKSNIANLTATYEARYAIFRKRGALGFLVSEKTDETGSVALQPDEKKEIREELNKEYGFGDQQSLYGVLDYPMRFIRTNMSIDELKPFDETLEDAVKIAALYGIPSVLVPRKDQATFSNQDAAEKSVYTSVIIPMAKRFCDDISRFLGLTRDGCYIDCDFSDVACLQTGLKEAVEVRKLTNEVCLAQFNCGLITINDWRAQIHEEALEGEIYDKVKFEMSPEELAKIDSVIKSGSPTNIMISGSSERNNQLNNQPSKDEEK